MKNQARWRIPDQVALLLPVIPVVRHPVQQDVDRRRLAPREREAAAVGVVGVGDEVEIAAPGEIGHQFRQWRVTDGSIAHYGHLLAPRDLVSAANA
jgi:hypothetical protein